MTCFFTACFLSIVANCYLTEYCLPKDDMLGLFFYTFGVVIAEVRLLSLVMYSETESN